MAFRSSGRETTESEKRKGQEEILGGGEGEPWNCQGSREGGCSAILVGNREGSTCGDWTKFLFILPSHISCNKPAGRIFTDEDGILEIAGDRTNSKNEVDKSLATHVKVI